MRVQRLQQPRASSGDEYHMQAQARGMHKQSSVGVLAGTVHDQNYFCIRLLRPHTASKQSKQRLQIQNRDPSIRPLNPADGSRHTSQSVLVHIGQSAIFGK